MFICSPKRQVEVIRKTWCFPRTTFLFLTKNPRNYLHVLDLFQQNAILGTTIETLPDYPTNISVTLAPRPIERARSMIEVKRRRPELRRFVSIEPIIDFNMKVMVDKIVEIEPTVVYIGYDNYGILRKYRIPEPPTEKTLELADKLREHGIEVRMKTIRNAWNEKKKVSKNVERGLKT